MIYPRGHVARVKKGEDREKGNKSDYIQNVVHEQCHNNCIQLFPELFPGRKVMTNYCQMEDPTPHDRRPLGNYFWKFPSSVTPKESS